MKSQTQALGSRLAEHTDESEQHRMGVLLLEALAIPVKVLWEASTATTA